MTPEASDLKRIKELIQIMEEHDLVEIQMEHGQDKVCLKRAQPQATNVTALPMPGPAGAVGGTARSTGPAGAQGQPLPQEEGLVEIKAPLVGTFYQASGPDSDPYVEVGSHVDAQMVVCVIEAMKVMNEIKAETSGTIMAVLARNGQAVQYGQPLFRVRSD